MPSRSIRIGVVVPRSNATSHVQKRKSIWLTHEEINLAVLEILILLLLMRGLSYEIRVKTTKQFCSGSPEDFVLTPATDVRRDALTMFRAAQARNYQHWLTTLSAVERLANVAEPVDSAPGTDAEVLALMRTLYEEIVPSAKTDENGDPVSGGTAQKSCSFIRNLMLQGSTGNLNCVPIAQAVPSWLTDHASWLDNVKEERKQQAKARAKVRADRKKKGLSVEEPPPPPPMPPIPPEILDDARSWLSGDECRKIHMKCSGRVPGWISVSLDPSAPPEEWVPLHIRWFAIQVAKATVSAVVINRLLDLKMLPLLDRGRISRQMAGKGINGWDMMAFKAGIGRLLSWETKSHEQRQKKAESLAAVLAARKALNPYPAYVAQLEAYETGRQLELIANAKKDAARKPKPKKKPKDPSYYMTRRRVKGWDKLRLTWCELAKEHSGDTLQNELRIALKVAQSKSKAGKFGDPHLYSWLIDDSRHALWQETADDVLQLFSNWRSEEAKDIASREHVAYCAPDAQKHPVWCEFEPKRGPSSNLRPYDLNATCSATAITLLRRMDDGGLADVSYTFTLAASRQLRQPKINQVRIGYSTGTGRHLATIGAAFLHMDRTEMTGRSLAGLRDGHIGKVRLVPTLDVEPTCPPERMSRGKPKLSPTGWHLLSALGKKQKEPLEPGLRVLAVNLNVLKFGGCSVFELVQSKKRPIKKRPTDKHGNEVGSDNYCIHVQDDFWAVHERSFLITLPGERPTISDRRARFLAFRHLDNLRARVQEIKNAWWLLTHDTPVNRAKFEKMAQKVEDGEDGEDGEESEERVFEGCSFEQGRAKARAHSRSLDIEMKAWLDEHRKRGRAGGREWFHGLKTLASVEYVESCLSLYTSWQRMLGAAGTEGEFHRRLREHSRHMKAERIRLGSSMIIEAARGIVGGKQRWDPCQLVLFENESRYRFSSDRSKAENRGLMRKCHPKIQKTTEMMGQLHGISVSTVNAGYISRIDAWTGSPGVRCSQMRECDAFQLPEEAKAAKMGDIVPTAAGVLLVSTAKATANGKGKPRTVNSDLNGAWTIQRRFWTRHSDVFRVRAVEIVKPGAKKAKKVKKAKKTKGKKAQAQAEVPIVRVSITNGKRVSGAMCAKFGKDSLVFTENCDGFVAEPKAVPDDQKGARHAQTLFRDPSGLLFPSDRWYESGVFWENTREAMLRALGYQT